MSVITIDGLDGTGKSTIVKKLRENGYNVLDRGLPTRMTEDYTLQDDGNIHIILDAPVGVCQSRILERGGSLEEKYHSREELQWYRFIFERVVKRLSRCKMISCEEDVDTVYTKVISAITELS